MICIPSVSGRLRRVAAAVSLVLLGALVGCSSGGDAAAPTATLGTAPPAPTTTDPYAVPPVIDEAYVNRVLEGLDAAVGEVVRMVVRERRIPYEAAERLQAIYIDRDAWQLTIDLLQQDSFDNFSSYKDNPGDLDTTVTKLLVATKECVFAEVSRDYSQVGIRPDPPVSREWVALRPVTPEADPKGYNFTRWGFIYDGFTADRSSPQDPCAGR